MIRSGLATTTTAPCGVEWNLGHSDEYFGGERVCLRVPIDEVGVAEGSTPRDDVAGVAEGSTPHDDLAGEVEGSGRRPDVAGEVEGSGRRLDVAGEVEGSTSDIRRRSEKRAASGLPVTSLRRICT